MKRFCGFLLCLMLLAGLMPAQASAEEVYPGQEFYYGAYEQDGNVSNGAESILWIVAEVDAARQTALVVSKYGLETMPYHHTTARTTWHNCDVRLWLNGAFFYNALNSNERQYVVETSVSSSRDMVFLLDEKQIRRYFDSELLQATRQAMLSGAYVADDNGCSSWWVRQDSTSTNGKFVGAHGKFYAKGNRVTAKDNVVRPAMKVRYDAIWGIPDAPLVPNPGIFAMSKMEIHTRSGPSTQYDGLGGYFEEGGYPVWVISKSCDNGGVWWLQIEFAYGGKTVRVYTGLKRVDVNINLVPYDEGPIGTGSVLAETKAYYGPGEHYKAHQKAIPAGTSGDVLEIKDGYVWLEFRNSRGKQPRRVWLPESCMNYSLY